MPTQVEEITEHLSSGMKFQPESFYHVYNRGNNKQKIFRRPSNYDYFISKVKTEICPYCSLVAYCLMPNHFHLLIYVDKGNDRSMPSGRMQVLERKFGTLQSSYTRAINKQERMTGSLFQQKMKIGLLNGSHLQYCFHYIHQNPVKARICKQLDTWKYSSYNEYCSRALFNICTKELAYEYLEVSPDPKEFIEQSKRIINNEKVLLNLGDWLVEG